MYHAISLLLGSLVGSANGLEPWQWGEYAEYSAQYAIIDDFINYDDFFASDLF